MMSDSVADMLQSEDKENVTQDARPNMASKNVRQSLGIASISDVSPVLRTPLSSINGQSKMLRNAKSLRRARYSAVTPVSTPVNHGAKSKHSFKSGDAMGDVAVNLHLSGVENSKVETPSRGMPLNALVYKKVLHIVDDLKQEHEREMKEKNLYIELLENQLKSKTESPINSEQDQDIILKEKVASFVQDVIVKASHQLVQEQSVETSELNSRSIATSPISFVESPSSKFQAGYFSNCTNCETCSERKLSGNSDWLVPQLKFTYIEGRGLLDNSKLENDDVESDSQRNDDLSINCDITHFSVESNEDNSSILMSTSESAHSEDNVESSPVRNFVTADELSETSPVIQTPKKCHNTDTVGTSPISVFSSGGGADVETMVTPRKHNHVSVMTERVKLQSVATSPIVILKSRNEQQLQLQKLEKDKHELRDSLDQSQTRIKELEAQLTMFNNIRDMFPLVKESQIEVQTMLTMGFEKMSKLIEEYDGKKASSTVTHEGQLTETKLNMAKLQTEVAEQEKIISELQSINKEYKSEILSRDRQLMTCRGQIKRADLKLAEEKSKLKQFAELLERNSESARKKQALLEETQQKFEDYKKTTGKVSEEIQDWEEKYSSLKQASLQEKDRLNCDMEKIKSEFEKEIKSLQEKIVDLQLTSQDEIERLKKDFEDAENQSRQQEDGLKHRLNDLQSAYDKATERLCVVQQELEEGKDKSREDIEKLKEKEEQIESLQNKLIQEAERLELEKVNLHRTLENREQDVDVASQERDRMAKLVGHQKTVIESLKKELGQNKFIKSQLKEVQEQMMVMQKSSRETQEFLEEERKSLGEDLVDKEATLLKMEEKLTKLNQENTALKATIVKMNDKYTELATDLDETKTRAHYLLLQQNTEITQTMVTTNGLLANLKAFQGEILKYLQEESSKNTTTEIKSPSKAKPVSQKKEKRKSRKSFIGSILDSVKEPMPKLDEVSEVDEIIEDKENQAPVAVLKPIIGAENSAFVRIHPQHEEPVTEKIVDDTPINDDDTNPEAEQMEPLLDDVNITVEAIVGIFRNLYMLMKAHEFDLLKHIQSVEAKLEIDREISSHDVKSLRAHVNTLDEEIKKACVLEKQLHIELMQANEKIVSKDKEVQEAQILIQERTERMEALAEQLRAVKREDKEVEKLLALCNEKDVELSVLRQTLDANLAEVGQKYGFMAASGIKELVHLRKQNAVLQDDNTKLQTGKDTMYQKCARRMEVFKTNWEKAEQEVARLDDLVEKIRQASSHHVEALQGCSKLHPLLQELGVKCFPPALDDRKRRSYQF